MTLGFSNPGSNGGNFLPLMIYDARAGRLFKEERMQGFQGWEKNRIDITNPAPSFCVDFGSIEVGVISFVGNVPDFKMVPLGQPMPAAPNKDYKQGFRVKVAGNVLGGVREFSHSALCVKGAMEALHLEFERAPEAATGKIPIVQLSGTTPVQSNGPQGKTTNYAPIFTIVGWADRLPDLGPRTVPPPTHSGGTTNGSGATHVPPPVAPAQPPPASTGGVPDKMPF